MQEIWEKIVDWTRDNLSEWTMVKVYIACAVAGGTVLIGQTGLNLFGLGGDTDVDPDVDVDDLEGGDSLNFLSMRALAGFLTFFGLVGWGGTTSGWGTGTTVALSFLAGAFVMVLVAWIMAFFRRLTASGNVDAKGAIGATAQVYLRIPANRSGRGKIQVQVQGREVELEAVTAGDEIPTGSACRVLRQVTQGVFEVEAEGAADARND